MATKGIDNLEKGFSIVRKEYENALNRFKDIDNKFNILLVFVAGEIAAFGSTFSLINGSFWFNIFYIALFCLSIFVSVLLIFIGLFTRKIDLIDTDEFDNFNIYLSTRIQFLLDYIATYKKCIKSIEKHIKQKTLIFNITIFFVLFVLLIFIVFMIVSKVISKE